MELEKIADVKRSGNGSIVELNNGYALAYEKRKYGDATQWWGDESKKNADCIVTSVLSSDHPHFFKNGNGHIHLQSFTLDSLAKLESNIPCPANFSNEFIEALKSYTPPVSQRIKEYEARIQSAYRKLLEPLGVEKYSAKDWGELGAKSVLASLGTVVAVGFMGLAIALFPAYLYNRVTKKETESVKEYFADFFRHHGDIDLLNALMVIAVEFPGDVYRFVSTRGYKYKIQRKDLLQKKPNGSNAALILYDISQTVLRSGSIGTPERFTGYGVIFPDGIHVDDTFAQKRDYNKEDYSEQKLFFIPDASLKSEIETCLEAIEVEQRNWNDFSKQLSVDSQNDLLKKIHFVT